MDLCFLCGSGNGESIKRGPLSKKQQTEPKNLPGMRDRPAQQAAQQAGEWPPENRQQGSVCGGGVGCPPTTNTQQPGAGHTVPTATPASPPRRRGRAGRLWGSSLAGVAGDGAVAGAGRMGGRGRPRGVGGAAARGGSTAGPPVRMAQWGTRRTAPALQKKVKK